MGEWISKLNLGWVAELGNRIAFSSPTPSVPYKRRSLKFRDFYSGSYIIASFQHNNLNRS